MSKQWKICATSLVLLLLLTAVVSAGEGSGTLFNFNLQTGNIIHKSLQTEIDGYLPIKHMPDQILVRFRDNISANSIASAHATVKATVIKKFRIVRNLQLVKLPRNMSVQNAIEQYRRNHNVLYAEPNYIVNAFKIPNDSFFSSLWGLQNTGQEGGVLGADIDAPKAWDISTGSSSVVVAIVDTGVDYNHTDLSRNMWTNTTDCNTNGIDDDGNGYVDDCYGIDTLNNDSDPLDDNNHGTHVSGIIGAIGNNNMGVVGVNWNSSIMACKFLDSNGSGDTAGAIECFDYIKLMKERGVNIIATSNSWGSIYFSEALFDAIDAHRQEGILCIAAAGNERSDNDARPIFPASFYLPNVISVAATDRFDELASFSNSGRRTVHLGAPGVEILSTTISNTYSEFSGTSMATPYVTGVAALLKAQNSARDWKSIKNLILAGGDSISSLTNTITKKRLNVYGAMTCSNSVILSRLLPVTNSLIGAVGRPIDLSALHIKCAAPNGDVNVVINPGGEVVTLLDNGLDSDQVAGDGIYSGQWIPLSDGTFTLTFPGGDVVNVQVDPDLEPGFPVKALQSGGTYHSGPAIHTLVGNIDEDPMLEIVVTGLASGPLFAWHADGSTVTGWPSGDSLSAGYPAMGNLSNSSPGFEVFAGYWDGSLAAYSDSGIALTGWPRDSANYVTTPPALADVDGDGMDEIFIGEEDGKLHGYKADGSPLSGWPAVQSVGGQERHTPAIADLDGDGDLEILTASTSVSPEGVYLLAFHHNGIPVNGFPVSFDGFVDTFPAIGDVDGDGAPEIVVISRISGDPGVLVLSSYGKIKHSMRITDELFYGTAPALADLDMDSIPEIIVQTNGQLNVWRGDGSILPGWPVLFEGGDYWLGNSSPVVGDVDGDGLPDIIFTSQIAGSSELGKVWVFSYNGVIHPGFPKALNIGSGAVPAIADIDLDGRNEIVITGNYWNGYTGYYDKVWVYDLGGPQHGPVQWGQFGGGPQHQGYYTRPTEFILTPSTPNGPTSGAAGTIYSYSTGDGSSNLGHSLEYRFSWGDGIYSDWSSSNTASKSWSSAGIYKIRAQARCETHTSVISSWSGLVNIKIASPTKPITLLVPNGGEVVPSGSTYTIQWVAPPEAVKFKILFSVNNGITWIPIPKTGDFLQNTNYDWQVPKPWGNKKKCLVKVIGYKANGVKVGVDKSDAPFTIEVIKLTVPNGGVAYKSGDPLTITWTTNATKTGIVAKVKLYYTNNGGVTWIPICDSNSWKCALTGNPGQYDWTVPTVTTTKDKCKVKVELKDDLGNILGTDASDSFFIVQP